MKKAVVFDNSGTLIKRYRVIKDVISGNLFTDINSLDLIDQAESLALVVLQYNTNKLLELDSDTLISDVIKKYDIGFPILREKVPHMELCNGSALIIDVYIGIIAYTITSAGKLFDGVLDTVNDLKSQGYEIFLASGDRKGAINKLACMLDINPDNAYGSVSTQGKCDVVKSLQDDGYKVMMVGDGLNDVLAFKQADVSVLTIEQQEEVSPKLMDKTDYIIESIREVSQIDF